MRGLLMLLQPACLGLQGTVNREEKKMFSVKMLCIFCV